MSGKMGRELVLRKALKGPRQSYDVILIDCPPALGLLTVNGLVASDWAIVSAEAQYFALQGVQGALDVVEQAKEYYAPDLELVGVLMNIADMRTVHSREAYATLAEHFPGTVFETVIRSSIAYAESAEKATSILDHRPDLGVDYLALADELLKRIGLDAPRRKLRPMLAATGSLREARPSCSCAVVLAGCGDEGRARRRAAAVHPLGRGHAETATAATATSRPAAAAT